VRLVIGVLLAAALLAGCGSEAPQSQPAPSGARLMAVGDGANGSEDARAVVRMIEAAKPDRLLYLGDVYENGTAEEFRSNYDAVFGALADRTWPTPGNHEWPDRETGYLPYWHGIEPWFAKRAGGWEILSLNSEAPHDAGSPQLDWLQQQLARRDTTCRLAYWHRPRFSDGLHGDQPDMDPVWSALKGHAAIVVNGHDHDMQRFKPIDGITEYVSGAGGADRYPVQIDDRLAFSNDSDFGALRIDLRPGHASLAFLSAEGDVLDRSTVGCDT
jgi:calcineurin-like phosphoesterase family protein